MGRNPEELSDRQLWLEIYRNTAIDNERLSHHLNNTCPRHEAAMADSAKEHRAHNRDKNILYGIAIVLPLLFSLLGYVWVTNIAMTKLETQIATIRNPKGVSYESQGH